MCCTVHILYSTHIVQYMYRGKDAFCVSGIPHEQVKLA